MCDLNIQFCVAVNNCILKLKCSYSKYKICLSIWKCFSLCCISHHSGLASQRPHTINFFWKSSSGVLEAIPRWWPQNCRY